MFLFNRKKNNQNEENNIEETLQPEEKPEEEITQDDTVTSTPEKAPLEEKELGALALFKDKAFDMEAIRADMKRMANLEIEVQEAEHPTFVIKTEDGTFVCTHLPMPVPNGEVQGALKFNSVEAQTVQDIENHQAFIVIARLKEPFQDRVHSCLTLTKIASVLMMQSNAAAMYLGSLRYILSPQRYYAFMGQIMQAESQGEVFFPYPLWIKFNLFRTEKGFKALTIGLREFGLYDLGFEETQRGPEDIFKILTNLCEMYLMQKCQFQDGDSMRLDPKTEATFKLEKDILVLVEK